MTTVDADKINVLLETSDYKVLGRSTPGALIFALRLHSALIIGNSTFCVRAWRQMFGSVSVPIRRPGEYRSVGQAEFELKLAETHSVGSLRQNVPRTTMMSPYDNKENT